MLTLLKFELRSIAWMLISAKWRYGGLTLLPEILRRAIIFRRTAQALALLRRHRQTHYALTVLRQIEAGQVIVPSGMSDDWHNWRITDAAALSRYNFHRGGTSDTDTG